MTIAVMKGRHDKGTMGMRLAGYKKGIVLAALLSLAGCVSLGGDTPERLITLTADEQAPVGATVSGEVGKAIVVLDPEADRRIDVQRVPVQVDASTIAYLKDAVWVERPARQFRRLLAETIRAKANRVVVEGSDYEVTGTPIVSGRLTQMGYDAQTQSVVVRFDAQILQEGGAVRTRRFEAEIPGVKADAATVAPALNRAANDVAKEVTEWLLNGQ